MKSFFPRLKHGPKKQLENISPRYAYIAHGFTKKNRDFREDQEIQKIQAIQIIQAIQVILQAILESDKKKVKEVMQNFYFLRDYSNQNFKVS